MTNPDQYDQYLVYHHPASMDIHQGRGEVLFTCVQSPTLNFGPLRNRFRQVQNPEGANVLRAHTI